MTVTSVNAVDLHDADRLADRYGQVRDRTEALAAPLSPEDQCVQSMPDVSPTKWHRAHVTWFFETFLLLAHLPRYRPFHEHYGFLFNSYYEAVGARHPRPDRGLITRPDCEEITSYRRHVDEAMLRLIRSGVVDRPEVVDLMILGLHHEQQHQELLLMDIKHVLASNVVRPAYRPTPAPASGPAPPMGWIDRPGGVVAIGHHGDGFHFDNEAPRHDVLLRDHRLADRLVTNGEWLEFIDAGGYRDPALWLSDGWRTVNERQWQAPGYWERTDEGWTVHTLTGRRLVDESEPVIHVSYYEADAFARWAGRRLPTEFEWEAAVEISREAEPAPEWHPRPAGADRGLRQMLGHAWQWTASAYAPYPGFRPEPGAVGEYNGKFMIDQQVLRGSACITPAGHVRPTYRNFFPAPARWMFAGVRLADDPHRE